MKNWHPPEIKYIKKIRDTIHFNDISPFVKKISLFQITSNDGWKKSKKKNSDAKKTDIKIILIKNESWSNLFVAFLNVIVVFTPKFNKLKKKIMLVNTKRK